MGWGDASEPATGTGGWGTVDDKAADTAKDSKGKQRDKVDTNAGSGGKVNMQNAWNAPQGVDQAASATGWGDEEIAGPSQAAPGQTDDAAWGATSTSAGNGGGDGWGDLNAGAGTSGAQVGGSGDQGWV